MNDRIPKPQIVAFEITSRCTLNCLHCRASAGKDRPDELTTGQCKSILKSIADFNQCIVILTGGEPMMRPDVYELAGFGSALGLKMVMATCGSHITRRTLSQLKEAHLTCLSYSLDGADAQTHDSFRQSPGAFDTVIAAIEKTCAASIGFQINTTITKHNIGQVAAIARLAERLGAVCFNPFILVPVGRAGEIEDMILLPRDYEKLLAELADLKKNISVDIRVTCGPQYARIVRQKKIPGAEKVTGCLAATGFAFISAKGDVQTCGFLDISAGNLVDNGFDFADIWLNSEFLNALRDHGRYKGACRRCAWLNYCRGCRGRAWALLGDYLQHDPICKLVQASGGRGAKQ